jgi:hypothetical protein
MQPPGSSAADDRKKAARRGLSRSLSGVNHGESLRGLCVDFLDGAVRTEKGGSRERVICRKNAHRSETYEGRYAT